MADDTNSNSIYVQFDGGDKFDWHTQAINGQWLWDQTSGVYIDGNTWAKPDGIPAPVGPGCAPGQFVASGSSCTFVKAGYTCDTQECQHGMFDDNTIYCKPNPCNYANLTYVHPGASSSDPGCSLGLSAKSGDTCHFGRTGYTCESTQCVAEKWSDHVVSCTPNGCNYDDLTRDATVSHNSGTPTCRPAPSLYILICKYRSAPSLCILILQV